MQENLVSDGHLIAEITERNTVDGPSPHALAKMAAAAQAADWHDKPAGRELDAIVAQRVMGYVWEHYDDGWALMRVPGTNWCAVEERNGQREYRLLPDFSTDIVDAWQVFGVLGGIVTLKRMAGAWYCGFGEEINVWADTAPHAICMAALTAVEVTP